MKSKISVLGLLLVCLCFGGVHAPRSNAQQFSDVDVLIIVSPGFGWSYFSITDYFESWGASVTTIALSTSYTVDACFNKPPRQISADILFSEFLLASLSNYDCVIVPSGGNWPTLSGSQSVLNLLSTAHEEGLVVATLCIGNVVVARANGIVAGCKVASFGMANPFMREAGAIPEPGFNVVYDNGIITGAAGGGLGGGGYEVAPIYEVCATVIRAVRSSSCVASVSLDPQSGGPETEFSLSVDTRDPGGALAGINSTDIISVTAFIHPIQNATEVISTVSLSDMDHDETYSGSFSGIASGSFSISIEVSDSDGILEVIRDIANFTITASFPLLIVGAGAIIGVVFVVIIGAILWKRRKNSVLRK
jgi:putative intracellular protease/amidase